MWPRLFHVFWPLITNSSPSATARGAQRGEVGAGVGLGHALGPDLVAPQHRTQEPLLLLVGAVGHDGRGDVGDADHVDRARGRRRAHLLEVGELLVDVRPPPAVLDRPGRCRPPGVGQPSVPLPEDLEVLRPRGTAGRPRPPRGSGGRPATPAAIGAAPTRDRRRRRARPLRRSAGRRGHRWDLLGGAAPDVGRRAAPDGAGGIPDHSSQAGCPRVPRASAGTTASERVRARAGRRRYAPCPRRPSTRGGHPMPELADLLAVFDLEPTGEGTFIGIEHRVRRRLGGLRRPAPGPVDRWPVPPSTRPRRSSRSTPSSPGARSTDAPLEFDVDVMQTGRSFASASVTARQGERLCTRSLVLLHAPDPDLIRHQPEAPARGSPEDAVASEHSTGFWEVRTVGGVDIADPDAGRARPRLDVWTRFPGAPPDPARNQALLAFATDGFLIGTAMRPHPGWGSHWPTGPSPPASSPTRSPSTGRSTPAGGCCCRTRARGRPGRSYGRAARLRRVRRARGVLRAGEHDPAPSPRAGPRPRAPRRPTDRRPTA